MAKMKDFLIGILEQFESGRTIAQIADEVGLPQDTVFDILVNYGKMETAADSGSL